MTQAENFGAELAALDPETHQQLVAFLHRWEHETTLYHEANGSWLRVFADGSIYAAPANQIPVVVLPNDIEKITRQLGWTKSGLLPKLLELFNRQETH
jgi:hypothetical protein